jgi:WhiB family redox-sensing transcriptional regulator
MSIRPSLLDRTAPDPAWAANAACVGHDPDLWFTPGEIDDPGPRQAIAICRTCPVLDSCLQYALGQPGLHGIWGGTTAVQRTRRRRLSSAASNPVRPSAA